MQINHLFCYYIAPVADSVTVERIKIKLSGNLFLSLQRTFDAAEKDCKVPISFTPEDGKQKNEVRTLVLNVIRSPSLKSCDPLMNRLARFTTHKSGSALVFVSLGIHGSVNKLLISRYKAEEAIIAEKKSKALNVEWIDNAYIKKINTYKGALFVGSNPTADFWDGAIIDRQVTDVHREVSNYWLRDFLSADFKLTPQRGSRILANAFRKAVKKSENVETKQELISAAVSLKYFNGSALSMDEILTQTNLSQPAREEVQSALESRDLLDVGFIFDQAEFQKVVNYKAVFLDTGGVLIAEADKFDKLIVSEVVDEKKGTRTFRTKGRIVDEAIRTRA